MNTDEEFTGISANSEEGITLISDSHFFNLQDGEVEKCSLTVYAPILYSFDNYSEYYVGSDSVYITQKENDIRCGIPHSVASDSIIGIYQVNLRTYALTKAGMTELCLDDFVFYLHPPFSPCTGTMTSDLSIIIGAKNSGLWIFENDVYKKFYVPGIEFPDQIKTVKSDTEHLWILSHDAGLQIFDWNKQVLLNVDPHAEHFGVDKWNTIYTSDKQRLTLSTTQVNEVLPDLSIAKLTDGLNEISHDISIGADENIYVHYTTNYTPNQEAVKVFYRIGTHGEYTEVLNNPFSVEALEAGVNHISLKATVDGEYYTSPVVESLRVNDKLLSHTWLYIFAGVLLLFLLSLFSLFRNKKALSDLEREKQRIRQELELLKSKQKFGQLQLNPHFLFNVLNSIGGLIALNENQKSRQALNQFSKMMRSTLDHSKVEAIPLEDEIVFLKNYLDLERVIRNESFSYTFDVDSGIEKIPPMIVQPFLENAIIHGFSSVKSNGLIECKIKRDNKHMIVTVTDNGIGRAAAAKKKSSDHESSGILIIRERLKNLDRWSDHNDHVTYQDLQDAHGRATGTKVIIKIPNR